MFCCHSFTTVVLYLSQAEIQAAFSKANHKQWTNQWRYLETVLSPGAALQLAWVLSWESGLRPEETYMASFSPSLSAAQDLQSTEAI